MLSPFLARLANTAAEILLQHFCPDDLDRPGCVYMCHPGTIPDHWTSFQVMQIVQDKNGGRRDVKSEGENHGDICAERFGQRSVLSDVGLGILGLSGHGVFWSVQDKFESTHARS